MHFKIVSISLVLLLSACGGGGSSSNGGSGTLGRCDFTADANRTPQVAIAITTGDQAAGDKIRSECERALVEISLSISCLSPKPTSEAYPSAIRTRNNGYTIVGGKNDAVSTAGIMPAEMPRWVGGSVAAQWLVSQGFTSHPGCR